MLGFIQFVLDLVSKALPAIAKGRKADRLNDIGVELFWFYVRVNEALMQGERIVNLLEACAADRRPGVPAQVEADRTNDLRRLLAEHAQIQRRNLTRIVVIVDEWSGHLQIIQGESYVKLRKLLIEKSGALCILLGMIDYHRLLPLSFPIELLEPWLSTPGPSDVLSVRRAHDEFDAAIRRQSIDLGAPWTSETRDIAKAYLAERNPRQQLADIRVSLEEIRSALADTFSLGEVLLKVGDERFRF